MVLKGCFLLLFGWVFFVCLFLRKKPLLSYATMKNTSMTHWSHNANVHSFSLISDSISGARGQQDGTDTLLGRSTADGLFVHFHCSSAEATAT